MRFPSYDDGEDPRWWPKQWQVPLWVWALISLVFISLASMLSVDSGSAFYNLFGTWGIIFGGIYFWRFLKSKYIKHFHRKELDSQRQYEEYHNLSPEENKIWEDLKNKLDK